MHTINKIVKKTKQKNSLKHKIAESREFLIDIVAAECYGLLRSLQQYENPCQTSLEYLHLIIE